ncbi:MAG TPA: aminotransferase class V-fold PLP-dependent enzyme, partial [Actinomycetota bacterium]|nr:aminotransferase class V-fold PLP-dependent enzyme [Actinomycetota bacterium]
MSDDPSSIPSLVPRDRYAALERCTYLNQASLGLIPEPTIEAMEGFLEQTARFGNLYLNDDQEAAILDSVRSAGAGVLGTSSDAVAVVSGASEGLGQATSLLEPDQGTVLLIGSDFPSVTYPWLAAAERGAISLRFVDDRPDRDLTQDLVDAIDPGTAVVAFGVVQFATGTRVDAGRVVERAHEVGARVLVDATQLAGAGVVDMTGWGADAVVTSGYKWLSAHGGVALLALVPELVDRVPGLVGWMGAQDPFDLDPLTLRLADDARRVELSTMSYVSAIG